jgi:mannose-6-phosphate isomerase-like protein (cupin superfamily)
VLGIVCSRGFHIKRQEIGVKRKTRKNAKDGIFMIVRNVNDREVVETTYLAHGGAIAQMILDRRILQEIGFLAFANLARGKTIESHRDPMEEIYFVLSGEGRMSVDEETKHVGPGDATWIPAGSSHSLTNSTEKDLIILVIASPNV